MTSPLRISPSGPISALPSVLTVLEDGIELGQVDSIDFVGIPTDVTASRATVTGLTTQIPVTISGIVTALSLTGVKNRDTLAITLSADAEIHGIDHTDIPIGFEFVISLGTATTFNLTFLDQSPAAIELDKIEPPLHRPYLMNEDEDIVVRRTATRWTFAAANRLPTAVEPRDRLVHRDDFTHVSPSATTVVAATTERIWTADGAWSVTALNADGSIGASAGQAGNPGVLELITGAVNGASMTAYQGLAGDPTLGPIFASDIWLAEWTLQLPSVANVALRCGFASNAITSSTANDAIIFIFDTAAGGTTTAITRAGGIQSSQASGSPGTSMVKLTMRQSIAGRFTFSENDVQIGSSITTNVPSAVPLVPFFQIITRTGAPKTLRMDLALTSSRRLAR